MMRVAVAIISPNAPNKAYDTARPKLSLSGTEVRLADNVTQNRTARQFLLLSSTGTLPLIKLLSPVQIQTAVARLFISLIYGMFRHLSLRHLFCFIRHVLAPANTVAVHCRLWLKQQTSLVAFGDSQL